MSELISRLRLWRADADLSGLDEHSRILGEIEARLTELIALNHPPVTDLEPLWQKAWDDSLQTAIRTVVDEEIDKAVRIAVERSHGYGV